MNHCKQIVRCLSAPCGDEVKMKAKLEYIWLDGYKPTQSLRRKQRSEFFGGTLEECPVV